MDSYDEKYGKLDDLPGNCEVGVSHSVYIPVCERGQGIGQRQHKKRLRYLQQTGHGYVICTVNATNYVELHILDKNGWKRLDSFISPCGCHEVYVYGRRV